MGAPVAKVPPLPVPLDAVSLTLVTPPLDAPVVPGGGGTMVAPVAEVPPLPVLLDAN